MLTQPTDPRICRQRRRLSSGRRSTLLVVVVLVGSTCLAGAVHTAVHTVPGVDHTALAAGRRARGPVHMDLVMRHSSHSRVQANRRSRALEDHTLVRALDLHRGGQVVVIEGTPEVRRQEGHICLMPLYRFGRLCVVKGTKVLSTLVC